MSVQYRCLRKRILCSIARFAKISLKGDKFLAGSLREGAAYWIVRSDKGHM